MGKIYDGRGGYAAAAMFLALLSGGCASQADLAALREQPGYTFGVNDGCLTAREEDKSFSTKSAQDDAAFKEDEAYRAGWRAGYLQCQSQTPDAIDGGRILGERNEY